MNETTNLQNSDANKVAEVQTGIEKRVPQFLLITLSVLAMVAFWGTFVYAIWVRDLELLKTFSYIIAIGAGIFGTIHFLSKLHQQISKS